MGPPKRFKIDGANAFWLDWENRRVSGWTSPSPKIGDELTCEMVSGKTLLFEFIDVEVMLDPPDQYFATVRDVDYIVPLIKEDALCQEFLLCMCQKRGELTERIKLKSLELFGYEVSQTELRLLPYIMDVMINRQKLDPNKINPKEKLILKKWRMRGFIIGGASGLQITEDFWRILCDLVFLGYVDITWEV